MKKLILLLTILIIFTVLTAGCNSEDNDPTLPVNDNLQVTLPPENHTQSTNQTESTIPTQPATTLPVITTQATTLPAEPTEPAPTAPSAAEEYRNQYTSYGEPVLIYEVVTKADTAVYSGNYTRYVYTNYVLTTSENWAKDENGDRLLITTNYSYDGKGHLVRTEERIPDADGNLVTCSLTEITNNTDGKAITKSITILAADGTAIQQTVYGYTYDDYGRETLCTVTEDGSFTEQTETVYTLENGRPVSQTATTTKYPDTPYEQISVLTSTFDKNGNTLSVSEKDNTVNYTTTYEYDEFDREVGSRTTQVNGSVTEYTTTKYEDLGDSCYRATVYRFTEDGSLYSMQVTCYDQYGNPYVPE